MASYQDQVNFIGQNLPYAIGASQQTGLPVDFILGQSANETGYGTSNLATMFNNFFGITNGGVQNGYASYGSAAGSFQNYADLINNQYDTSGLSGASAFDIASSLQSQGYAQDPNYGSKVAGTTSTIDNILQNFGLSQFIGTPASGGTSASGTGSNSSGGGLLDFSGLTKWANSVGLTVTFVLIGIVLLIAALFMFGQQVGVVPPTKDIVKGAGALIA